MTHTPVAPQAPHTEVTTAASLEGGGTPAPRTSDKRTMAPEDVSRVLARNSVASITQDLDDGHPRTHRAQYVFAANELYLPAWTHPESFYRSPAVIVECDVSELDGLSCWNYVWIRGVVTPLQPTGDSSEREVWRYGVAQLRRVIATLGPTEELAFANFGIFRVDIRTQSGVRLR